MGRIILGLLASLLLVCSLPARANALEESLQDPLMPLRYSPAVLGTVKKHPSICWTLRTRPPVGATMVFTLMDIRSIKPVLEVQLPNSIHIEQNETCDCVNLKDYDIQLEPDIQYRWYLRIARKPESRPQDVVVAGLIARCGEEDCQVRDMPSQCDRDFARVLAIRGFWTDSMSCLCDLIKSSPDDKTLLRMRDALMRQIDLSLSPN
jgi:hypothetical protein